MVRFTESHQIEVDMGREMERKKGEEYNHSSTCRNFQGHCWQRAGAYVRENWLVSGLKPIQSNPLYL